MYILDFSFFFVTPHFPLRLILKSLQSGLDLIWIHLLPLSFIILTFMAFYVNPYALCTAIGVSLFFLFRKQGQKGYLIHILGADYMSSQAWKQQPGAQKLQMQNGTGFSAFQHGINYSSNYITALAKIPILALKQITCWCPLPGSIFQLWKIQCNMGDNKCKQKTEYYNWTPQQVSALSSLICSTGLLIIFSACASVLEMLYSRCPGADLILQRRRGC